MLLLTGILVINAAFSQRSKHGVRTITAANTIVNEYTSLTSDAASGATTLNVTASTLNTNGRFAAPLAVGDLLMIIQIQGVSLNGVASGTITTPNDQTWGAVTSYNNCGNYEFVQVSAIPNGTSITIDCGLQHSYTAAGRVQVIRVPRYSSLTINASTSITCDAWNGSTGGVVAIESGNISVNGQIVATGKGFRGGQLTGNDTFYNLANYATISTDGGGEKGEGVFGYQAQYNVLGGSIGRGAAGNAGGGGNGWTNGGGGGANAGNVSGWNGQGNPDNSVAGWTNAWNLEGGSFSTNTSSGGGRGGYSWSSSNQNATTTAPGLSAWGGDYRANHGGLGGRPLDYSTGKIFLGGGGGAGDQDNSFGGVGGQGGGLIFIQSYGTVTGSGSIVSNGNDGAHSTGTPPNSSTFAGKDAAGGGGAGGTILVRSQGVTGITLNANGGAGGRQIIVKGAFVFTVSEAEGPGGGGGGGYIAVSSGTPTQTVLGGANGITNSDGLTEFPPNGATRGGAGLSGQSLTNFDITAVNASVCSGSTASLSVNISGTPPAGYGIVWYDAETGGNILGTGTTFTTPSLTATTTYYAAICPGFYRIPVIATVVPGITVNVSPVSTSVCSGASTVLTATGGTTYSWNPSATLSASSGSSVSASPTSTTTYTVTGTSGTCTDTAVAIVNISAPPVVSASPATSTICSGSSVSLTASGAASYSWSPSAGLSATNISTVSASPLSTITYTVTGTVAGGCTDTATVAITVNTTPVITVSPSVSTICEGSSVTLAASGGTTYNWTPSSGLNSTNASTVIASPSATITYTVSGTTSGCSSGATAIVNVTTNPSVTVIPVSSAMCEGSMTTLTASGASSYTWNPATGLSGTNTASVGASPTSTMTYTVTGTSSGCTDTAITVLTVHPLPTVTVSPSSSMICSGSSVNLTASGVVNCTWSPTTGLTPSSGLTVTASPTATATYTATGTSSQGCSNTTVATVTVIPVPVVSVTPSFVSICAGGSTVLTATGASTFSWTPTSTLSASTGSSVTASPTSTTTYTVTGTDNGCTDTSVTVVTVSTSLNVTASSSDTTICDGASATLTGAGASTYAWSPSAGLSSSTGQTVTATPSSTITYTLTGTSGSCTDTATVVLNVSPVPVLSLTVSDTTVCAGESVLFNVSGATSYTWSGQGLSSTTGSSVTAVPLATSTYTVAGISGGCSDTLTKVITVETIPLVSVTPSSASLCAGGSVALTASGATTYEWSPSTGLSSSTGSNVTASPSVTTTYTLTGTQGGCTDTTMIEVAVVGTLTASVTPSSSTICAGDTVQLTATGGATYSWIPSTGLDVTNGSVVNASPTGTTTYTVIASSGSCSDTAEAVVNVTPLPVLSAVVSNDTICAGTTSSIDVTGAMTYSWTPSSALSSTTGATVLVNPAVTESFTVIGYNGSCSDTLLEVIVVEPLPVVTITLSDDTLCSGTQATLTASGATLYEWSPATELSDTTGAMVIANPSVSTTFTVTGTTGSCSSIQTTYIEVIEVNLISNVTSAVLCEGDSVHLVVSGADTYQISPMTGVTVNAPGDYYVKPTTTTTYELVGSGSGCSDTLQIPVTVTSTPVISVTSGPQTICKGSSTSITVSGATTYQWSPSQFVDNDTASTVTATPDVTTTFTVAGFNGSCGTIDTIIVNVTEVNVSVSSLASSVCPGSGTILTASGADTYIWFPSAELSFSTGASVTATPTATSTYSVAGTDVNGCADTATISISLESLPVADAGPDHVTCYDGTVLNAIDPFPLTGSWNIISGSGTLSTSTTSTTTMTGLTQGLTVLTWTVTNACGSDVDTINVTVTSGPDVTLTASPAIICDGSSSMLSVSATGGQTPYNYSWSNGATGSTQNVSPATLTTYSVMVTDALGCPSSTEMVTVDVSAGPVVDAGNDVTIFKGESTVLTATGAVSYSWSPGATLSDPTAAATTATPELTTIYAVTGTDVNGCSSVDSVTVNVEEKTNVFIPDIFSPNNDGRNDILYVRGGNISSFRFFVFDRWGEKVFETEDQTLGWDGTLRGRPMDEAVYVFILKGTYLDGSTFEINGNVTLIR